MSLRVKGFGLTGLLGGEQKFTGREPLVLVDFPILRQNTECGALATHRLTYMSSSSPSFFYGSFYCQISALPVSS